MNESHIIGDEPCPKCREAGRDKTGNHLILYSNGNKFCNRCGYKVINGEENNNNMNYTIEDVLSLPIAAIPERRIDKDTAKKYGYRVEFSDETGEIVRHFAPYYKDNQLVGFKVRNVEDKSFYTIGDVKGADPFGSPLMGNGGKLLIITEGELDAMAASIMFKSLGKNYRVISLPTGANATGVQRSLDKIAKFENVVLCFDQDEKGQKAVDKVIPLFNPGQVKVMTFSEKDANDMLLKGKAQEFYQSLSNAAARRPDGIVTGADTWERIKERPKVESVPYPDDWVELNQKTYGVRIGEIDTWTSGSGY